jgi:glutamyl-tRNA reductase
MHKDFKALSVSYKKAQLHVREQVALSEAECRNLLSFSKEVLGLSELLLVSTCNRTEFYYSSQQNFDTELIKLLASVKGLKSNEISHYFERISNPNQAILHLFNVSIGLESQVVGDLQIINQIKRAYQLSAECEMAGPFLHRLLHTIFYTNKRVVQETSFKDGAASVSYAAYETLLDAASEIRDPKILLLGTGEIGIEIAKHLVSNSFKNVCMVNRTFEKAQALAQDFGFSCAPLEDLWKQAAESNVIVSSVSAEKPILTFSRLKQITIPYSLTVLDLSVPRSAEPEIENIPGVFLYNIDQINDRTQSAVNERLRSIPQVVRIVEEMYSEFMAWSEETSFSPIIQKMKEALEKIRIRKVSKHIKQLSEGELQKVEDITKEIMEELLSRHVKELKSACQRGNAEQMADIFSHLFDIENNRTEKVA